ncbi:MAG: DUF2339 domain-containing protein, partial [Planctomycetota bacterium]|nr:DUF2339 domain-containing protein [Planctomycetota bacterium]
KAEVVRTDSNAPSSSATGAAPPSAIEPFSPNNEKRIQGSTISGGKRVLSDLEEMIGGRWLTWIGATSMLVAIAFFIPWAWKYFQTPEWFKVIALHASSIGVLFFGLWLRRRQYVMIGHAVVGIGLFAWYGTALAALRTFDVYARLFGEAKYAFTALECTLITAVAIVLAVRHQSKGIILIGALGGYLNPILTRSGEANYEVFFVYLAFLNVGLVIPAILRQWNFLKLIALVATALMFLGRINGAGLPDLAVWTTEWLATLHAAIFFLAVTLPPIFWHQRSRTVDLMTLVGASTGFMALTWTLFHSFATACMGLVAGGMAILHLVFFFVSESRTDAHDRMPRTQLALSLIFFTLIAPLQLENLNYLSVAWAAEGLVLMGIGLFYRDRQFLVSAVLVYVLSAYRFTLRHQVESLQLLLVSLLMLTGGSLAWWIPRRKTGIQFPTREWFKPLRWESVPAGIVLGLGNILLMVTILHYFSFSSEHLSLIDRTDFGYEVLMLWSIDLLIVWMLGLIFDSRAARIYAAVAIWPAVSLYALLVGGSFLYRLAPVLNPRFASLLLLTAVAFAIAGCYRYYFFPPPSEEPSIHRTERKMRYVMGVYGCFVLFMGINLEIENYFKGVSLEWSKSELATYSIAWILFAVAVVLWGFITKSLFYRVLGLLAFIPILIKVFLIDLSQLDQLARILAAFALGLALLGISFLYQRIASRVLE